MFGAALRLLAVGEAGRRVGDYVQSLVTKYLVLTAAGTSFFAAIIFGILAGFWALTSRTGDSVTSAGIMAGILASAGLLIALLAYGTTRPKQQNVRRALTNPAEAVRSQVPGMDDVGRRIEDAAKQYGPVRVAVAAAAGGMVVGILAKRFRQI